MEVYAAQPTHAFCLALVYLAESWPSQSPCCSLPTPEPPLLDLHGPKAADLHPCQTLASGGYGISGGGGYGISSGYAILDHLQVLKSCHAGIRRLIHIWKQLSDFHAT